MLLRSIETVATITVLQLPPNESRRRVVNNELRYGIWAAFPFPFAFWFNETMTCSRYVRERLIDLA